MNQFTDVYENIKPVWQTPSFKEIPIAFEATCYALSEDDNRIYS